MNAKAVFFAFLLYPSLLIGLIVESSQFEEILHHVEKTRPEKTVVVCDIDNTLMRGSQHLGCVAWGEHVIAQLEQKGVSKREAKEIESILWRTIQPHVKVIIIDSKAPNVIHEIQKRKIPILGLTARSPEEAKYTIRQLLSLGMNLSDHSLTSESLVMPEKAALYDGGILFGTTVHKKSTVLFHFLDKHTMRPECIIFIDDKLDHVEDLAEVCEKRNISYIGIRFSAADNFVKSFDHQIADIQWEMFPSLISNEQALHMLISRQ